MIEAGGPQVEGLLVRLWRDAPFAFGFDQFDEDTGDPLDFDEAPYFYFPRLAVPVRWTATITDNTATWSNNATETAMIPDGARVELWITAGDRPRAAGQVSARGR